MGEVWKSIPGHEGRYEVSDLGRVRSLPQTTSDGRRLASKVLCGRPQRSGHLSVPLTSAGTCRNALVHRLVLIAFVGPPPLGMHALHSDGNPANNRLSNLRWGTPSENSFDAVRHGVHPQARKTHCKQGHEFTPENTRIEARGSRACRECERNRSQRRAYQRKAA